MSKRLQVVLDEAELARFQRAARERGLTLAQWVRETLRASESTIASGDVAAKLAAIRAASQHAFPAPDVEEMLAEIERGYSQLETG